MARRRAVIEIGWLYLAKFGPDPDMPDSIVPISTHAYWGGVFPTPKSALNSLAELGDFAQRRPRSC